MTIPENTDAPVAESASGLEPGTIERHDFGSKAGDPDWCYSCGEHRNHPAHAESQRPYPFTLLDLDIARIIDPSSFLPGADEQGQNLAIAKAKRITKAATAALGAQTPSTPTPPVADAVASEQVDYPRILSALTAGKPEPVPSGEHRYAERLLIALMEKHYPDRSPEWAPLPDLMGILTQIDNLTTGLVRAAPTAEAARRALTAQETRHD